RVPAGRSVVFAARRKASSRDTSCGRTCDHDDAVAAIQRPCSGKAKQARSELSLGALLEDEEAVGRDDLLPAVDLASHVDEPSELIPGEQLEPGVIGDATAKFRPLQQQPVAVLL